MKCKDASALEDLTEELKKNLITLEKEKSLSTEKYKDVMTKRKLLLNELEDIKGKIRVFCRIRPYSKSELNDPERNKMCCTINDQLSVTVHGRIDNTYNFNSVYGADTS